MTGPTRNRVLSAAAASTALLVIVVLFVNATTASRVAANAERLHWTNATLGTASSIDYLLSAEDISLDLAANLVVGLVLAWLSVKGLDRKQP